MMACALFYRNVRLWRSLKTFSGRVAVVYLLLFGGAACAESGVSSSMQRFMAESENQWQVYQRKVEAQSKESNNPSRMVNGSPTLIAMKGLDALRRGEIGLAKQQAAALDRLSVTRDQATWFEFRWDYSTTWPYELKTPWISGLAQGLGLALNTWLYQSTHAPQYLAAARSIARSYTVPIGSGGFARRDESGDVQFEEYPLPTPTRVLNGAAIATLALADYANVAGDHSYDGLLQASRSWWERNIDKYILVSADFPEVVSAYSLAPRRDEVLFRFLADKDFDVVELTLKAKSGEVLRIPIGRTGDDSRSATAYVWFNTKFQNWSDIRQKNGLKYRAVVAAQGEYNHAPFSFALTPQMREADASLQVHVANVTAGASILVQIYTGKEYVSLGNINGPVKNDVAEIPIPRSAFAAFEANLSRTPPVEPGYFADNQRLIGLLADAFDSKKLRSRADYLKPSVSLTPGPFDASSRVKWLDDQRRIHWPLGNGMEAFHTEYASVIESGNEWHLFYSAIGEDHRWRIRRIDSSDKGNTWSAAKTVFAEDRLPFKGSYAFPRIFPDPLTRQFVMVFSADLDADGKYDVVMLTSSNDLSEWSEPRQIVPEGGLAPVPWFDGKNYHVVYSINDGASYNFMETRSLDLLSWSRPQAIASIRSQGYAGFYTLARLPKADKDYFMFEQFLAPKRIEWRVMCRTNNGKLIDVAKAPFFVLGGHPGEWNDYQYGMSFLASADKSLYLFFNGIPYGAETGGSLGMAKVDQAALWNNIDTDLCH